MSRALVTNLLISIVLISDIHCSSRRSRSQSPLRSPIWLSESPSISSNAIIDNFNETIIGKQVLLKTSRLTQQVLSACCYMQNVEFADKVWNYITKEGKCLIKPEQILYVRLMTIYASSNVPLKKVTNLVDEWINQYKTDRLSLNTLAVSPVILNQILKNILFRISMVSVSNLNYLHQLRKTAIYYFQQMIELDIVPNDDTFEILKKNKKLSITPNECINFILKAKRYAVSEAILNKLLFSIIGDKNFIRFDNLNQNKISKHLLKLSRVYRRNQPNNIALIRRSTYVGEQKNGRRRKTLSPSRPSIMVKKPHSTTLHASISKIKANSSRIVVTSAAE